MFAGRPAINGQLLVSLGITEVRRSVVGPRRPSSSSPQTVQLYKKEKTRLHSRELQVQLYKKEKTARGGRNDISPAFSLPKLDKIIL